jgi:dUTP pyrophosphatase
MALTDVRYYKLNSNIPDPKIATTYSACFDLSYCADHAYEIHGYNKDNVKITKSLDILKTLRIFPGERLLVPTGLIFDIPVNYSMRIHPRSSTGYKLGLMLANNEGVVDADYKQECFMLMVNTTNIDIVIENNTRLCQAEIVPVVSINLEETSIKPGNISKRNGGFGSTGS